VVVHQQPGGPLGVDPQQLCDSLAFQQGHQVVAADEIEHPGTLEAQQDSKGEVVARLQLVELGCTFQQRFAVSPSRPYPAHPTNSLEMARWKKVARKITQTQREQYCILTLGTLQPGWLPLVAQVEAALSGKGVLVPFPPLPASRKGEHSFEFSM